MNIQRYELQPITLSRDLLLIKDPSQYLLVTHLSKAFFLKISIPDDTSRTWHFLFIYHSVMEISPLDEHFFLYLLLYDGVSPPDMILGEYVQSSDREHTFHISLRKPMGCFKLLLLYSRY